MLDAQKVSSLNAEDNALLNEIFIAPSNTLINDRFSSEQHSSEAPCGTACGAGCGGGCGGRF